MKKRPEDEDALRLERVEGPWASVGVEMVPVGGFRLRQGLSRWDPTAEVQDDDGAEWLVTEADQGRRSPLSLQPDALTKPSIAREFERLGRDPAPARILRFANRYGFLGPPTALVDPDKRSPSDQVPVSELMLGELVSYWQEEAARFRDLRTTWGQALALTDAGPQSQHDAHAYLVERIYWSPSGAVRYQSQIETRSGTYSFARWIASAIEIEEGDLAGRIKRRDLAGPARLHVHREVNERLRGHVSPAVPAFLESPVMRNFPDSLLAAIYFRFALDLVSPTSRESICDHCHQPFVQGRSDKRFCSKNCKENARYHREVAEQRRP